MKPTLTSIGKQITWHGFAIAVILCLASGQARADARQYKIESAYLYSFFNYITWPGYAAPQDLHKPLICIYGKDPIQPYLEYIRNKVSGERSLSLRSIADGDDTQDCQILFVRHRLPSYMLSSLSKNTLVVFKPDDPLDRGGMIELSEDGERIAMKIDQDQLERKGFQVSSRLLSLARGVK